MSGDYIFGFPDPEGSTFDKFEHARNLFDPLELERALRAEDIDPELLNKIVRGLTRYEESRRQKFLSHLNELEAWANIHAHPGTFFDDSIFIPPYEPENFFLVVAGNTNVLRRNPANGGGIWNQSYPDSLTSTPAYVWHDLDGKSAYCLRFDRRIFKITPDGTIELYDDLITSIDESPISNGSWRSSDGRFLYIAARWWVVKYDLQTKSIVWMANPSNSTRNQTYITETEDGEIFCGTANHVNASGRFYHLDKDTGDSTDLGGFPYIIGAGLRSLNDGSKDIFYTGRLQSGQGQRGFIFEGGSYQEITNVLGQSNNPLSLDMNVHRQYIITGTNGRTVTIGTTGGDHLFTSTLLTGNQIHGVVWSPDGSVAYALNWESSNPRLNAWQVIAGDVDELYRNVAMGFGTGARLVSVGYMT